MDKYNVSPACRRLRITMVVAIVMGWGIFFSCGVFDSSRQVEIRFPEPVTEFEAGIGQIRHSEDRPDFLLKTWAPGGGTALIPVSLSQETITIPVVKGQSVPVYGELYGCDIGPGGFIPQDIDDDGRLLLSWEGGFWASLFLELEPIRLRLEAVNLARLRRSGWERSSGNPWALDRERLLRALRYNRLNSYQIALSDTSEVDLPTGRWIPANPFFPTAELQADLPRGIHDFLNLSSRELLRIQVTDSDHHSILRQY